MYKIHYGTCKQTYIGQTSRTLHHRIKEHKITYFRQHLFTPAVVEHAIKNNHAIDQDTAEVIDS